jgi:hypothetical protein
VVVVVVIVVVVVVRSPPPRTHTLGLRRRRRWRPPGSAWVWPHAGEAIELPATPAWGTMLGTIGQPT